jgi:hypothetical protein
LALGGAIDDSYVRIDYLSADRTVMAVLPSSPVQNVVNCAAGPGAGNCVRFVRARLCMPASGAACDAVPYQPMLPLLDSLFGNHSTFSMPHFNTEVPAESLGYTPPG